MDNYTDETAGGLDLNLGYPLGRLARAFRTSQTHEDAETQERAEKKIASWVKVFEGMLTGALQIGSRTPVAETPPWATLEVINGGFATGELLAGGPLQPHEQELLARLPTTVEGSERATLNGYYLTDEGMAELRRLLANGCYRVTIPEEGVLLVVAWLLDHGDLDAARDVLDEVGPFLSRLRFYPVPDAAPLTSSSVVYLQDVRQTIQKLVAIRVRTPTLALREAVQVWAPLYDRVVALFFETVEGAFPSLQLDARGEPIRDAAGRFLIEGGWPCQLYPDGWPARARSVLEDYRRSREVNRTCSKPDHPRRNFARLRGYLETCVRGPRNLSGRDVGMIRLILAGIATHRGTPDSSRARHLRQCQAAQANAPTSAAWAKLLIDRLASRTQDGGLESLDDVTSPATEGEGERHGLKPGLPLPRHLVTKVRRCLAATVPDLVEAGVIPSGEILARVIPQITAQVRAVALSDADLRRLYGAIYTAFRRRRSLLLLNLASQVRIGELPWVGVIERYRQSDVADREQARQTLEQVVSLAITAFPQEILPNKLLQEIRSLAESAGIHVPIVDEVAADIFMGVFTQKFLLAAQMAGAFLTGTLYERYYGIPYDRVRLINDAPTTRSGPTSSAAFLQLCAEMAGEGSRGDWSVARNGKIIEQEQILTTHNLAVLFEALALTETLRPRLRQLSEHCFEWICRRLQQQTNTHKTQLRVVKNAAYAWRQMIFFLALLPPETVEPFLIWAKLHLGKQGAEFQERFQPALEGLRMAARGASSKEVRATEFTRFLGWTTTNHWLLAR